VYLAAGLLHDLAVAERPLHVPVLACAADVDVKGMGFECKAFAGFEAFGFEELVKEDFIVSACGTDGKA